jgi:lysozyme
VTWKFGALAALLALVTGVFAPPAQAEPASGIDISRFEGRISWGAVERSGIDFAFVQASRGRGDDCSVKPWTCGPDGFYEFNYARARAEGIRVGAYHRAFAGGASVAAARRDARAEAQVFLGEVKSLRPGDLLPALDFETPFGRLDPRRLRAWIKAWSRAVEERLGAKPIIYTNAYSWGFTGDAGGFARAGHPLWVAHWGVSRPLVPACGWGSRGWSVWQYTNAGRVPGIKGRTDMNRLGVPMRAITAARAAVPPPARTRR